MYMRIKFRQSYRKNYGNLRTGRLPEGQKQCGEGVRKEGDTRENPDSAASCSVDYVGIRIIEESGNEGKTSVLSTNGNVKNIWKQAEENAAIFIWRKRRYMDC